ncbi:MAG: Rieske 2Fe-2S domain-containing protein [Marmoricola sp.]
MPPARRRTGATELPARLDRAPGWVRGPRWEPDRLLQAGWVLLPLRLFLGVTFCYAGLSKLANPSFFDASSSQSVQAQMRMVAPTSPIGPLVDAALHTGWLIGLVIALAELAVGLGTLAGLRARVAAVGGLVLSLSFFLTVSWTTSPYFYGADIVFCFAWTPFLVVGAAGVCSLDARRAGRGRLGADAADRRALLGLSASGLVLAVVALVAGRVSGTGTPTSAPRRRPHPRRNSATSRTGRQTEAAGPTQQPVPRGMHRITPLSGVRVGHAVSFQDPQDGNPAWLVRLGSSRCAAFSAVCTHAGCTVRFDRGAQEFVCPCHGGTYSAHTGRVLGGPPPAPLPRIRVAVRDGEVYGA